MIREYLRVWAWTEEREDTGIRREGSRSGETFYETQSSGEGRGIIGGGGLLLMCQPGY